ncbi:putative phosphotransferase related to Ser/Thr protein kinases [Ruegeria denitrificans]|uniref:Putative phosphotransferase related to Ser/Thr protein kinases n=1 Tax=Ruegeria denitrificans TaxID=1715692 RepID=A0A0P1II23_9RHOB|nr:phosphotransferase [Ruegeria denitrificans]CUK13918.1 putative phosphotransferase related to Ser/Thr protein kinases [Ruegeria denitrificans]
MTNRAVLAEALIAQTPWSNATRAPLAGDASNRRYERLTDPDTGRTAVFMDSPPGKAEPVEAFVRMANHLREIGLSAPEIYAEDTEFGFLLLEDLGDDLFALVLKQSPQFERELYEAATDVLIELHKAPTLSLPSYDPTLMTELAALSFTKYAQAVLGEHDADARVRFENRFADILHRETSGRKVVIQRDYHAENMIWLPERDGVKQVGLLDFQTAMLGHPAYDLVSMLQDVRRDVAPGTEMRMVNRYITATGVNDHDFRCAYAVLGTQRNLRILGVFARLATDYGKPQYIDLIPATWAHLMRDLNHPALVTVADLLRGALPAPTPENLDRLRQT